MNDYIHITGGADEYHAAAIMAVIHHVRAQAAAVPTLGNPNAQSAWLRSGRQTVLGRFQPPVIADPGLNWPTR
jgi:hypothetical protein